MLLRVCITFDNFLPDLELGYENMEKVLYWFLKKYRKSRTSKHAYGSIGVHVTSLLFFG